MICGQNQELSTCARGAIGMHVEHPHTGAPGSASAAAELYMNYKDRDNSFSTISKDRTRIGVAQGQSSVSHSPGSAAPDVAG